MDIECFHLSAPETEQDFLSSDHALVEARKLLDLGASYVAIERTEIEAFYVLIAEGGGWPTHALGPFLSQEDAERYMNEDKWRESWGSVSSDPRDLVIETP